MSYILTSTASHSPGYAPRLFRCLMLLLTLALVTGCGVQAAVPSPTPNTAAPEELIFYNWAGDMPQSILDAFTAEYGIKVTYKTYDDQEQSVESIKAGTTYDVAVVANEHVPELIAASKLAKINFSKVPNFKNISPNFRDLAYDAGNQYSVPYHWGTTALVVRSDLVQKPVTRWADLWDPSYAGKIATRAIPRDLIGFSLLALGYSFNSEDPAELEAALEHLIKLKKSLVFVDVSADQVVPRLVKGEDHILVGWSEDALDAQRESAGIRYVLPEDGPILWGDNFTIPASSQHKEAAELLINFLLRPEISAKIVNEKHYATPNEAAAEYVDPKLLNDPIIFPPDEAVKRGHLTLALSPEGEELYEKIWQRFLDAKV